jgi:ABC-type dipeptide/oligopeptide/nickel transport system ATPase component
VTILNDGVIVEFGPTQEVLDNPQNEYTRRLLSDTPTMFDRMPGATPPSQPRASDGGPAMPVAGSS